MRAKQTLTQRLNLKFETDTHRARLLSAYEDVPLETGGALSERVGVIYRYADQRHRRLPEAKTEARILVAAERVAWRLHNEALELN